MPTLAVTGADNHAFLPAAIRTMQELPDATVHIFSRVCHLVPMEVPAELAAVIDDFVQHGTGRDEPQITAVS